MPASNFSFAMPYVRLFPLLTRNVLELGVVKNTEAHDCGRTHSGGVKELLVT